jgi:hypothetical protein
MYVVSSSSRQKYLFVADGHAHFHGEFTNLLQTDEIIRFVASGHLSNFTDFRTNIFVARLNTAQQKSSDLLRPEHQSLLYPISHVHAQCSKLPTSQSPQ